MTRVSLILLALVAIAAPRMARADVEASAEIPSFSAEWLALYGHRSAGGDVDATQASYALSMRALMWGDKSPIDHFAGLGFEIDLGWVGEATGATAMGDGGFLARVRMSFPWLARLSPRWALSLGFGAGIKVYSGDRIGEETGGEVYFQSRLLGDVGVPLRIAYELDHVQAHRAVVQTAFGRWTVGANLVLGSADGDRPSYRELGLLFGIAPIGLN